jgi:hypothetical protein
LTRELSRVEGISGVALLLEDSRIEV